MQVFFKVFIALLLLAGINGLYGYFDFYGAPTSAADLANSTVIWHLTFILIAIGLIARVPFARTAAIASNILVLLASPVLVIYVVLNAAALAAGAVFYTLWIAPYLPSLTNQIVTFIVFAVICCIAGVVLAWKSLKMLTSEEIAAQFDENLWFGRTLRFGRFDGRVALTIIALIGIRYMDSFLPESFTREHDNKVLTKVVTKAAEEFNELPEVKAMQAKQEAKAEAAKENERAVTYCAFSTDETKLLLTARDKSAHVINLRTGKGLRYDLPPGTRLRDRIHGEDRYVGSDGDSYFDESSGEVRSVSNARPGIDIGKGRKPFFVGFTEVPTQVIVFYEPEKKLVRLDLSTNQAVWEVAPPFTRLKQIGASPAWSPRRNWVLIGNYEKEYYLLDATSGDIKPLPLQFKYPEKAWFDIEGKALVVSGESDAAFKYNTYLVKSPTGEVSAVPSQARMVMGLPNLDLYLYSDAGIKALKGGQVLAEPSPVLNLEPSSPVTTAQEKWMLYFEEGEVHAMNTATLQTKKVSAWLHEPKSGRTCLEASSSGRLVAAARGRQLEVFWASELDKPTPRTFKLELDIK